MVEFSHFSLLGRGFNADDKDLGSRNEFLRIAGHKFETGKELWLTCSLVGCKRIRRSRFLRARRSGINEDVEEIRSELDGINAQLATIDIPDEEYSPNGRHMSIARKNFNIDPKKTVLWSFRLPGESQKIDRMVNAFARRYCANNPGVFSSVDTCYILCFAIVMLNTALHNRNVKTPLTLDGFIAMYHGIDEGRDVPRELLESIYESIRTEPFQFPTEDGEFYNTFFNPDREGWLLKQAEKCLYYFEHTTKVCCLLTGSGWVILLLIIKEEMAKEPRGIIPLENVRVRPVEEKSKPYCFEIYSDSSEVIKACKTEPDGRMVVGRHTSYKMCAFSQEEMNQWISAIDYKEVDKLKGQRYLLSKHSIHWSTKRHVGGDMEGGIPRDLKGKTGDESLVRQSWFSGTNNGSGELKEKR
ncbi:CYH4 [Dirofilaria immitis]|nr:CYH4 [Dirofilaria immitis]